MSSNNLRGSFNYLWDITKTLGQGATSMVYRGRNKNTGEEVAVKVFSQAGNLRPAEIQMREYTVMAKLKHKNIVSLLDIEQEQGTYNKVIVMDLTEWGSLFNMLEEPRYAYGLPEEEFLTVLDHVTCGMKHLRDNGIVHRDIKPGNILRFKGEDGRSIYKLTDFGAARELAHEEEQFMSLYGTEEYLHPDIYERAVLRSPVRRQFTSKVDLWSLGATFYHVATGQLPFKAFGGRKNRDQMYQITRNKESGVISGVQSSLDGPIAWSRELPATCRLSMGLKRLVTPLLAGLLETEPSRVWTFESFFEKVEIITQKVVVYVFSALTWSSLRVYLNKKDNYTAFQELIAEQTEIPSSEQLLVFDGQLFKDTVQPMSPVISYPKGITERNPVFCFSVSVEEGWKFPTAIIKPFPKFTSSLTSEDYIISKVCTGVSCQIHREVKWYTLNQELIRRAVHVYVHELYHECGHLDDYHCHLVNCCRNALKWKDNFFRTAERDIVLIQLLLDQSQLPETGVFQEWSSFTVAARKTIDDLAREVSRVNDEVTAVLMVLKDNHLTQKKLLKLWNDSIGCVPEDRCVAKVEMVLDQITNIKTHFQEDRKKTLSFNDQQIHKFEKNKLSELAIKIKSLFTDHCESQARQQFTRFQEWYRNAQDCRIESQTIEKTLLKLCDLQDDFVHRLSELCLAYDTRVKTCIQKVKDHLNIPRDLVVVTRGQHSSDSMMLSSTTRSQSLDLKLQERRGLLKTLITQLNANQQQVYDMKKDLETNSHLIKQFNTLLQTTPSATSTSSYQPF